MWTRNARRQTIDNTDNIITCDICIYVDRFHNAGMSSKTISKSYWHDANTQWRRAGGEKSKFLKLLPKKPGTLTCQGGKRFSTFFFVSNNINISKKLLAPKLYTPRITQHYTVGYSYRHRHWIRLKTCRYKGKLACFDRRRFVCTVGSAVHGRFRYFVFERNRKISLQKRSKRLDLTPIREHINKSKSIHLVTYFMNYYNTTRGLSHNTCLKSSVTSICI